MIARALTIAGSDPTGGAGIQQDLKVFDALGVWGCSAITAITVQDTASVRGYTAIDPAVVVAQIDAVATDVGVDAAKTGMIPNADLVIAVARACADRGIDTLVVDPVMRATVGGALAAEDAVDAMRAELVPRALLITPNAYEAERLAGVEVAGVAGQIDAGRALLSAGARAALITGGHLAGAEVVDVLVDADGVLEVRSPRVEAGEVHGTGCTLSAAITAELAKGAGLRDAVATAQRVVGHALRTTLRLGRGAGLLRVRGEV